jgi:hypothetical protein
MGIFSFFRRKKVPLKETLKEKRLIPRWKISAPAKIKWNTESDYSSCEVKDLNMRGCALFLTRKIPEGCVGANLYFNEKYFFDIEMAIVWQKEVDNKIVCGIRFTKFRDVDKEKIYKMICEDFSSHLNKI